MPHGDGFGTMRELDKGMMHAIASSRRPPAPSDFLFSLVERAEAGLVVVDPTGRAVFMNASARRVLESPTGELPEWTTELMKPLIAQLSTRNRAVERWSHSERVFRVLARPLDRYSGLLTVLELTVVRSGSTRNIGEQLSRNLELTITDGKLLGLVWRGMSNEQIAQLLDVRLGTIKSRLFRLYQRLGVRRRPAAVLRAAEVLGA